MSETIPTMFTDKYIDEEIARLDDSILSCDKDIASLTADEQIADKRHMMNVNERSEAYKRTARILGDSHEYAVVPHITIYDKLQNESKKHLDEIWNALIQKKQKKAEYQTKKNELVESRQIKTEEQRAEEHYQKLLNAKNMASTEEECQHLAKRFMEISNYKDAAKLATDCNAQGRNIKERNMEEHYQELKELIKPKRGQRFLSEKRCQDIARQFREMNGYKDTAELAMKYEEKGREIKKQQEERVRVYRQQHLEEERVKQQEEERAKQQQRIEQERRKIEERRRRRSRVILWTVLSGSIGGVIFALFKIVIFNGMDLEDPANGATLLISSGIIVGILAFIWGCSKEGLDSGCSLGCGGIIGGGMFVFMIGTIATSASLITFVIIGVVVSALIGMLVGTFKS